MTDMEEIIQNYLSPAYPWRGSLTILSQVDSTNNRLKALANAGAPHGTAIVADHQTGGRGRRGRTFQSPANMGVYLSMLLRPPCEAQDIMHLTCAAGCAMCDAVEKAAGFRPGIKWTNDLVWEKRKLGGILTELGFTAEGKFDYAIVGIGINCCQSAQDFPPEIRDVAASLSMVTGSAVDRWKLAAAELESLWEMDKNLLRGKKEILFQYRKDCVTLGQHISLVRGEEVRHGFACDIDNDGALIVRFPDGHMEAVSSGEVSVRGMYGYV